MKKIIDYRVLSIKGVYDLENFVKNVMKNGWQPFGGISKNNGEYTQVMVKYED